jgi:hypothetical protein
MKALTTETLAEKINSIYLGYINGSHIFNCVLTNGKLDKLTYDLIKLKARGNAKLFLDGAIILGIKQLEEHNIPVLHYDNLVLKFSK